MRTLIIEDNAELARLLAERLNARGIDCDIAGSILEADDYMAVGQFDTIMLDLGLPDGDGIDWLRGLPANRPPVLILSARSTLDDRVTGLDTGADDYLVKPAEVEEIAARLRALAGRVTVTLWSCVWQVSPSTRQAGRRKSMGRGWPSDAKRPTFWKFSCVMPAKWFPGSVWKEHSTARPTP